MYAKVFAALWDGTLYGHSDAQLVFIFLLARADREGFVEATHAAIAGPTGLTLERVRTALEHLEAPDPQSRSPEESGSRLERLDAHRDWGWRIVNYLKYRNMPDADTVREQAKERQRRRRNALSRSVTVGNAPLRHADVDVEADAEAREPERPRAKKRRAPPQPVVTISPEQREAAAKKYGLEAADVEAIAERIEAEAAAGKYVSAPGALHTWCRNQVKFNSERASKNNHANGADSTDPSLYTRCTLCGYGPLKQERSQREGLCGSCRMQQASLNAI